MKTFNVYYLLGGELLVAEIEASDPEIARQELKRRHKTAFITKTKLVRS